MIYHKNRDKIIYLLSLDKVLKRDIIERFEGDKRFQEVRVLTPGDLCSQPPVTAEDIRSVSTDTLQARLLIFDVRSLTLARLQQAYNQIIGLNRPDLNKFCYTITIGDGPANLFGQKKSPTVFGSQLAKLRNDYSAAAFFYDPLMHFEYEERPNIGPDQKVELPDRIPNRLKSGFQGEEVNIEQVRAYFRAAGADRKLLEAKKQRRLAKLEKLIKKSIAKNFGTDSGLEKSLTQGGYEISGEPLPLNVYPFFFEDKSAELLNKALMSRCA